MVKISLIGVLQPYTIARVRLNDSRRRAARQEINLCMRKVLHCRRVFRNRESTRHEYSNTHTLVPIGNVDYIPTKQVGYAIARLA